MKTYKFNFKNLYSVFFFSFMLVLVSCDKEVTELEPLDRITESLAFSSPTRVELSMVGVYDAAQSGFYAGGAVRGYPFGAANVEQGDMRGEDMINIATFFAITYEANYSPGSANNVYQWHTLYNTINKANIVIEGVQTAAANGIISDALAKEYEGEARFIRALSHHELLVHFARPYNHTADASHMGVPYRTLAVNTGARLESEIQKGRNTVAECYNLLLEDLKFAEDNLPATRSGTKKITRATKGAAYALASRVLLHKGDMPGVIAAANNVTGYTLAASPEGVFASYANNSESIFSIENSATDNPGVNGSLPNMFSVSPGRALIGISPIMYNNPKWIESDLGRSLLVKKAANGFFSHKYREITTQEDFNPIIRYAEVVLNSAEAYVKSDKVKALELLNSVRNRAVIDPSDQYTDNSFGSDQELLDAILFERRIELLGEGRRWPDIHRLAKESNSGIPAKVAFGNTTIASWGFGVDYDNGQYTGKLAIIARPYDDFRFLWPIPQDELNTNVVLRGQQNPGY